MYSLHGFFRTKKFFEDMATLNSVTFPPPVASNSKKTKNLSVSTTLAISQTAKVFLLSRQQIVLPAMR